MSRMFRIITERGIPAAADGPEASGAVAVAEELIPFVEVGGPEGVVASVPKDAPPPSVVLPQQESIVEPAAESEPAAAGHVPHGEYLSVAFHRLPKVGLRIVPHGTVSDLVVYHHPDHPISREYGIVRDELRRQFEETGPRALGFAAGLPESGTTTVTLNLAASLACEVGSKVLVVDANLTRPAAAARLGVANNPGLAEVLAQATPLAWAVQPTPVANLHVLAAGKVGDTTAGLLSSDFARLLGQLRTWFDWVLVDGGVWAEAADRGAVAAACDAAYFVTRQADIDRPEFTGLRAAVTAAGGLPRGYITTRV